MSIGQIIITNDIEREIEEFSQTAQNVRVFYKSDFNMNEAKMVINESAISSNTTKNIILAGDSFNVYAQNALLKLLEEPPPNINFTLITKSKNSILPTIISRMIVHKKNTKKERKEFDLNLKNLNLSAIKNYVEKLGFLSREETRELIESVLFAIQKEGLKLSARELDFFNHALECTKFYESPKYLLLELLLMILEHKRAKSKEKICLSQK